MPTVVPREGSGHEGFLPFPGVTSQREQAAGLPSRHLQLRPQALHVSAEMLCEIAHKALPQKRRTPRRLAVHPIAANEEV
jgi:hypothetical protein